MNAVRWLWTLLIGPLFAHLLVAESEAPNLNQRSLEEELSALTATAHQHANQYQKTISSLEENKAALTVAVEKLREKRRALESSLSGRGYDADQGLEHRVDAVTFLSGRTVPCRVMSYRNQQFTLEDQKGNQITVFPKALSEIQFRKETQAILFPDHVLHPVVMKPKTFPSPTPRAKKEFALKEHMMFTRIIRKKSSETIDEFVGFIDEVAENIQYTCRVESRALPDDAENLRMRIWVFAEDTNHEDSLKLIIADSKRFDLSRIGEVEFDTKEVVLKYDDKGAKYGHKLYGWVFTLEDSKGNVVHLKRSKKKLADNINQIRNMSVNAEVEL